MPPTLWASGHTIGGLLLSSWQSVFGIHDSLSAPFAGATLFVEGTGIAVLGAPVRVAINFGEGARRGDAIPSPLRLVEIDSQSANLPRASIHCPRARWTPWCPSPSNDWSVERNHSEIAMTGTPATSTRYDLTRGQSSGESGVSPWTNA